MTKKLFFALTDLVQGKACEQNFYARTLGQIATAYKGVWFIAISGEYIETFSLNPYKWIEENESGEYAPWRGNTPNSDMLEFVERAKSRNVETIYYCDSSQIEQIAIEFAADTMMYVFSGITKETLKLMVKNDKF